MASLVKDSRSPFYWARFRDSNGKEFTRSTKERERDRAMEVALSMEDSARSVASQEFPNPSEPPMLRLVELEPSSAAPPSIREEVEEFACSSGTISGISIENKQLIGEIFIDFLGPEIATLPLRFLSHGLLNGYRAFRRSAGIDNKALNLELIFLRSLCQLALKNGRLSVNIVDQIPLESEEKVTVELFSREEFSKLMHACSRVPHGDEWRCLFAICMMTGQPLASVAALRIRNLNIDEGTASLQFGQKGYSAEHDTTLEFHPLLLEYLFLHNLSNNTEHYIFPSLANRPLEGPSGLMEEFASLMACAGIEKQVIKTSAEGIPLVSNYSSHSLENALPIAERSAVIEASFQKRSRVFAAREDAQQDQPFMPRNTSPSPAWTRSQGMDQRGTRTI